MLYKIQEYGFNFVIVLSYILYFGAALGVAAFSPNYIELLDFWIKIYICFFLLWRFHPFTKRRHFSELDRQIAFSAGCFLLATTAVNQYLVSIVGYVKKRVVNTGKEVINSSGEPRASSVTK
jgi:uncharacterized BrkB/YihY/UPF0761 family membrane protein